MRNTASSYRFMDTENKFKMLCQDVMAKQADFHWLSEGNSFHIRRETKSINQLMSYQ